MLLACIIFDIDHMNLKSTKASGEEILKDIPPSQSCRPQPTILLTLPYPWRSPPLMWKVRVCPQTPIFDFSHRYSQITAALPLRLLRKLGIGNDCSMLARLMEDCHQTGKE
jgi:hypothetical protein